MVKRINQMSSQKKEPDIKSNKEHKQDTKPNVESNGEHKQDTKPNIKSNKEHKQDVKKPDMNKITYEEEKVALVSGITSIFTVWWMFKLLIFSFSLS